MAKVSAPYNFVPLNKKVFFPPWADLVNHDVPFKNGLSGQIELKITAETPIFIRGKEEVNEEDNRYKQYRFPKKDDRYYIPGSSIKGEISNILEIMTFSKLWIFNDEKFGFRDWENSKIYNKSDFSSDKIKGGWLTKTSEGYKIEYSTKEIGRISHIELDKKNTGFSSVFSKPNFDDKDDNQQTAKYKYRTIKKYDETNGIVSFDTFKFSTEEKDRKLLCEFEDLNGEEGTIILTGQSSARKEGYIDKDDNWQKAKGKGFEFVFWKTNKKTNNKILLKTQNNELHPKMQNFFLAYNNHKPSEQTEDWKMWMHQLNNGFKVPVFLRLDNNKNLIDFGISMLYRIIYEKSVKDIIKKHKEHFKKDKDFIETLFGSIDNEKSKGRVHFSHAFSINKIEEFEKPFTITLGSPKASFYPFYIKQNFRDIHKRLSDDYEIENETYLTFNDGEISGRKRYPAINETEENLIFKKDEISTTTTTMFPLKKGAKFKCSISYHNLLKEELGALLSALTFHKHSNYKHKIGAGKPLGMGSTSIVITKLLINNSEKSINSEIDKYLCVFEKVMKTKISDWINTEQLKELFAIATPVEPSDLLKYLLIIPNQRINDFSEIKKLDKKKNQSPTRIPKALPRYSVFMNITPNIETSIINDCKLSEIKFDEKELITLFQSKIEEKKTQLIQKIEGVQAKQKKINDNIEKEKRRLKKINEEEIVKKGISNFTFDYKNREAERNVRISIDKWLKKSSSKIFEKDYDFLENVLKNLYQNKNIKQRRKWDKVDDKNPMLKKLKEWIGNDEKAEEIYKNAINKKQQ